MIINHSWVNERFSTMSQYYESFRSKKSHLDPIFRTGDSSNYQVNYQVDLAYSSITILHHLDPIFRTGGSSNYQVNYSWVNERFGTISVN